MLPEDSAYALKEMQEQERRLKWLQFPHMEPLAKYVSIIKEERGSNYHISNFDPCDGGINAKALFLLEAPGPKAVETGFISRNNPDQTAKNLLELMEAAAIPRTSTLFWNVIPWYIGEEDVSRTRPAKTTDMQELCPTCVFSSECSLTLKLLCCAARTRSQWQVKSELFQMRSSYRRIIQARNPSILRQREKKRLAKRSCTSHKL